MQTGIENIFTLFALEHLNSGEEDRRSLRACQQKRMIHVIVLS